MRSVTGSALGSLVFLVLAPGTVAGWIPWRLSRWRAEAPFLGFPGFRVVGILLILAGVGLLLDSFARFALKGRGTPAPLLPTERLVVSGLYRYVRNPMYVGVVSSILGQACVFGSAPLVVYGAVVWLAFFGFVLLYEEPTLRAQFGEEYIFYCRGVRRWWPRLAPWSAQMGNDKRS